jgi:hypothetical protein
VTVGIAERQAVDHLVLHLGFGIGRGDLGRQVERLGSAVDGKFAEQHGARFGR